MSGSMSTHSRKLGHAEQVGGVGEGGAADEGDLAALSLLHLGELHLVRDAAGGLYVGQLEGVDVKVLPVLDGPLGDLGTEGVLVLLVLDLAAELTGAVSYEGVEGAAVEAEVLIGLLLALEAGSGVAVHRSHGDAHVLGAEGVALMYYGDTVLGLLVVKGFNAFMAGHFRLSHADVPPYIYSIQGFRTTLMASPCWIMRTPSGICSRGSAWVMMRVSMRPAASSS